MFVTFQAIIHYFKQRMNQRTIITFSSSLQQKEEIKEGTYKYHVYKSLRNDACLCAVRKPHNADLFDQCKSLNGNSVMMMIKQTDDQQKYDNDGRGWEILKY